MRSTALKFRATRDARKVCGDVMEMRGGIGYIEEFVTARLLRDVHLGPIWKGTGNIVTIGALTRAVGRHGADAALAADLHARLDDSATVPQAWRSRLHELVDRAIAFAREVAGRMDNEAEGRRPERRQQASRDRGRQPAKSAANCTWKTGSRRN
jgi:hypothetical protein